jgi:exonuclease III
LFGVNLKRSKVRRVQALVLTAKRDVVVLQEVRVRKQVVKCCGAIMQKTYQIWWNHGPSDSCGGCATVGANKFLQHLDIIDLAEMEVVE